MTSITSLLKRLNITDAGHYDNHFYVVELKDSDDYARAYTNLEKHAINTEYPGFEKNTNDTTTKITNYFESEDDGITYNIFLMADFNKDKYIIKIGEK